MWKFNLVKDSLWDHFDKKRFFDGIVKHIFFVYADLATLVQRHFASNESHQHSTNHQ